jgi:hypothetical protein
VRIIQLTENESANADVMAHVARYLLSPPVVDTIMQDVPREATWGQIKPAPEGRTVEGQGTLRKMESALTGREKMTIETGNLAPTPKIVSSALQVTLAPEDNPSAGFPPDAPPAPDALTNPASIGFGLPFPGATVPVSVDLLPPTPSVPNIPGTTDLDVHGLPWDARIHSGGKGDRKNADGSWRRRRGVEDDEVARVEAELRQIMAIPALAPTVPPIPTTVENEASYKAAMAGVPVPPAPVEEAPTFASWMAEVAPAMNRSPSLVSQELFTQLIKNALGPDGSMQALVLKQELIPPVRTALRAWLDANHPGWDA